VLLATPAISPQLEARLDELDRVRSELGREVSERVPWIGALRRQVRARSVEGSTSIEGFSVAPGEALALVNGEHLVDLEGEDRLAVACYARAMDRVGVLAGDPAFRWLDRVILDLHFDVCSFQRDRQPGLWRTGPIGVTGRDGRIEYRAPDAGEVPGLMAEVVEWLQGGDLGAHAVVRAAMAHLHVISVHPFSDGNGRISRIVQSLVLAREGLISPEFGSIEEYLAGHTADYYAALNEAHGSTYEPQRDASGWIAFCVEAHLTQARQRLVQIEDAEARWGRLTRLIEARGWPDRLATALEQCLAGGSNRAGYSAEVGVSPATASADFRRLLDAGLAEREGAGRNVCYRASELLRAETAATPAAGTT
jgi:Fic family protein